jgi:hypothetical protein
MRRATAGRLLIGWLLIDLALFVYTQTAGAHYNSGSEANQQIAWTALDAFLVWRVWRGGRIAWGLLIAMDVIPLAMMLLGGVGPWRAYDSVLYVFVIAQLVILLTPAVRHHVSRGQQLSASKS